MVGEGLEYRNFAIRDLPRLIKSFLLCFPLGFSWTYWNLQASEAYLAIGLDRTEATELRLCKSLTNRLN